MQEKVDIYSYESKLMNAEKAFQKLSNRMHESEVVEDLEAANPSYTLNCRFIILIANKNDGYPFTTLRSLRLLTSLNTDYL